MQKSWSEGKCEALRGAPGSQNTNLEPLVEGPAIRLAARHTKIRREGYLK